MRRVVLAAVLAGCTAPNMQQLRVPPAPSMVELPEECPGDCDRDERREAQTWRAVPGVEADRVRIVVTGDAGVRDNALSKKPSLAEGALQVAAMAEAVCAGDCDASVFLGDNLYPAGIGTGERGERDRANLQEFRDAYGFTPEAYFVLGNHDWGAYPTALATVCRIGPCDDIGRPSRARAQRQLDAIRDMRDTHGDAHFWEAAMGPVHTVALDTVYLSRRCHGQEVDCRGDKHGEVPLVDAIGTMLSRADKARTVVFGHHPRVGNGEHGSAGHYRDFGPFALDRGQTLRTVLDAQVADGAALYFSGHDHSVQVHDDGVGTLSLVIGAGAKTSPPGLATEPEARRHEPLAFEAWCRLGFAVVDAGPQDLAVQVYTLAGPETHDENCPTLASERRPTHMAAQAERPEEVLGAVAPEGDQGHDLRCTRWELAGEVWSARMACAPVAVADAE